MQDSQGKVTRIPLIGRGPIGERSNAIHVRKAHRAGYWPIIFISMIIAPMIVVLGFYAAIPARSAGPAAVNLGGAGNFVILAETTITTTGTTAITGNVGISPNGASSLVGFAEVMDASGTFSTSALVTGNIYAADYTPPTPTTLTTAINDMGTAYTTAAGLPADVTELGSGDITSQVLTPQVYKWSTDVLVGAAGVTFSGTASDVWVLQIAGTLTLASSAPVSLTGGAVASHIFWQVAGAVTIGTNAAMSGVILAQTNIAIQTGASLNGMALAQTAVTMDSNVVTSPGTAIPEFSQILIPMIGMLFVVGIVGKVRNQKK